MDDLEEDLVVEAEAVVEEETAAHLEAVCRHAATAAFSLDAWYKSSDHSARPAHTAVMEAALS